MTIDFGRHSEDYALYRPGPPSSFYRRLEAITPVLGTRTLDLGTGPGTIALALAERGSVVFALDLSLQQIRTATRVAAGAGLSNRTAFWVSSAERTGLPDDTFDLITAGQCWHWFDRDRAKSETLRLLRPGGLLAIVDYAYLAEHDPVARDSEELILQMNPAWNMAGSNNLFPERIDDLIHGGFELVEAFCYDTIELFSHERWRGRMRTCNGVGSGGLSPEEVIRFDETLRALLEERYPDPMEVRHRLFCVIARKPLRAHT